MLAYKDPEPVRGAWRRTAGYWATGAGFALLAGGATRADDGECEAWQVCSSYRCAAAPGRCGGDSDCTTGQYCIADNRCTVPELDGSQVMLWGTLGEGMCGYAALGALDAPERPVIGWGCDAYGGMIDPFGEFVWDDGAAIRRLVPDAYEWDDVIEDWVYPRDPLANDPVVLSPPPGCTISRWIMKAGTGEVFSLCNGWRDASGALRFTEPPYRVLRAWSASDLKLLTDDGTGKLYVVDAAGTQVLVPVPMGSWGYVAGRTYADGFRVVVENPTTHALEAWIIDAAGGAPLEGAYPAIPSGWVGWEGDRRLDGQGALYQLGVSTATTASTDIAIRRTFAPPSATLVYDESNAPTGVRYVRMHGSHLVTGP